MGIRGRLVIALVTALAVATAIALAGASLAKWARPASLPPPDRCTINALGQSIDLDPAQATNAATIAAVAIRRGLPPHAVTVALATALQESKLRNLPSGDRDSVGLFQQRPSQGWGTAQQILDPRYAANRFYARLAAVPGWQALTVAEAAQRVQRSADGSAYAIWEAPARSLAQGLTGRAGAAVGCRIRHVTGNPGTLAGELRTDYGEHAVDRPVTDPVRGWAIAGWLVTHTRVHRLTQVSYLGRTWTASTGRWAKGGPAGYRVRYVTEALPAPSRSR